jgi:UDP-N-acetylglucosamine--N-acetylmuramyl-(pentapeptide) pyrophosphoryl-undecaprenol N-acetylglucosamine transferase
MPGVTHPPTPRTILLAGGGSGGHISPGLAIAERVDEIDPAARCLFACSTRAIDAAMLREAGAEFVPIPAAPLVKHPVGMVRFLLQARRAKAAAIRLIRERRIDHVIALGGFVAAPVAAAARRCRVPITLVNLDVPPGKANRWIAKRADRVLSAAPWPARPNFAEQIVGLPLRRRAIADRSREECRRALGLDPAKSTLLVTGASQGSRSINRLVMNLAAKEPALFRVWQVHHLAGHGDDQPVRAAYAKAGVAALVEPFSYRMGLAWGAADLAVSRAGANSVAEVAANAVPTLFLPYPHHRDQHQFHNAQPLVDAGGAVVERDLLDDEANRAAAGTTLRGLMEDDRRRETMRTALKSSPPVDAAAAIARIILGDSRTWAGQ